MDDNLAKTFEQAAALQKLWSDSFEKMTHVWSQFSPGSPPVEEARKMRSGMLNVMAQSLDEFMRTPQFLEMMKSTMDGAMQLKGMTREGLHKMQDQFEIPHKEDLDGVLLALRHVERRLLERIEDLEGSMSVLDKRAAETNKELERIDERIGDLKSAAVPVKSSSSTTDVAPAAKGPDQPKKTTTKAAAPKGRKKPQ